jgi:hypothetical protein
MNVENSTTQIESRLQFIISIRSWTESLLTATGTEIISPNFHKSGQSLVQIILAAMTLEIETATSSILHVDYG